MDVSGFLDKAAYLGATDVLERAVDFAVAAHAGQKRHSGEDYVTHPLAVAEILVGLKQDLDSVVAGVLHDTLEDTSVSETEIREAFGETVLALVHGVTKLGKIYFGNSKEAQAENYRRLFMAMAEDLRVIVIKLADRLHNMRTLSVLRPDKQVRIAKETMDIFAPLAHRLGMGHVKWELEDLAFMVLDPDAFQGIKAKVATKRGEREDYVALFSDRVKEMLSESGIMANVSGRPKHFHSIYRKLERSGMTYDELYDLMGIRVITESIPDCYSVLGLVHAEYKPLSGRFKDYIAVPKSNFYQSLHTTVLGPDGKPVEVQIRTRDMDSVAEYGIAAHWEYKEDGSNARQYHVDFAWLRQILESGQEDSESFLHDLKLDLFDDEVFAFTPTGDVQVLPKGATPVDFAYKVHTDVGSSCVGAKVNGHIVNLDYSLCNGDQVEILTQRGAIPKLGWLEFVKTRQARNKIKTWFRKQMAEENREKGKLELEKALITAGYLDKDLLNKTNLKGILDKHNVRSIEELFLIVSYGDISPKAVIKELMSVVPPEQAGLPKVDPLGSEVLHSFRREGRRKPDSLGISVMGESNIEANLAKCCNPLPGDDVVGFVTMGHGVSVHRLGCQNISNISSDQKGRIVEVAWTDLAGQGAFPVSLLIDVFDRPGLLNSVLGVLSEMNRNVREVHSRMQKDGLIEIRLQFEVGDFRELERIKAKILMIDDVISVARARGA